jgi:LmbE family N-acetylglucosaminyl deacetylase
MPRRTDGSPARDGRDTVAKPVPPHGIRTESILVLAPHMDDETLACGGTMLLHADRRCVHCLFATDGARSPAPPLPWLGKPDPHLPGARRREALAAATRIGIPHVNLRFLDLPDGRLASRKRNLVGSLREAIADIGPAFVLAPFRHDVHPDHIALNRAARTALRDFYPAPALLEYFVYHRLRGLPGGDVRRAIDEGALLCVDIGAVAAAKREALDCYRSQTTVRYAWQTRPILTPESLEARCSEPEWFLPSDPRAPVSAGLRAPARVRLACLAMRYGKPPKERVKALLRWARPR